MILLHIENFLDEVERELAYFTEQPFESIHFLWKLHFAKFKTNMSNANFQSALIRGLVDFNANNL